MKQKKRKRTSRKVHKIWRLVLFFSIAVLLLLGVNIGLKKFHDSSWSYQMKQGQKEADAGNYEDAEIYYQNAIALNPNLIQARFALAETYLAAGDEDQAEETYLEILKKDDQNEDACRALIDLYEKNGELSKIQALGQNAENAKMKLLFEPYMVPEPQLSVPGGTYEEAVHLELTADGDFEIYYTIDGSDPKTSGELYLGPIDMEKDGIYTVKAVCRNQNDLYGSIETVSYSIDLAAPGTPALTPEQGDFASESTVYISGPAGCEIHYTWDGTTPDESSPLYEGALTVPEGNSVLSVVAFNRENGKYSEITRGYYTYYPE